MSRVRISRPDIDLIKILSAFGIVWFHSGYFLFRETSYAGLSVFIIITAYYMSRRGQGPSMSLVLEKYIIPCIAWSSIYLTIDILLGREVFPQDMSFFNKVIATPAIHLWYFTFISIGVFFVTLVNILPVRVALIFIVFLFFLYLSIGSYWRETDFYRPYPQFMHAFVPLLIGSALGLSRSINKKLGFYVAFLIIIYMLFLFWGADMKFVYSYLVATVISLILFFDESLIADNEVINLLSRLTLGIYVIHPLFLFVLRGFDITGFSLVVVTFFASAAAIHFLRFFISPKIRRFVI